MKMLRENGKTVESRVESPLDPLGKKINNIYVYTLYGIIINKKI